MGARPLRRAIQRYIEDPLADFVLRAQVPPGSTVLVEPGEGGDSEEDDVKLSVIEPAPKPTPVGVGAEGGSDEDAETSPDDAPAGEAATGESPAE
jgi:ATP-dependent Clp protease ATP-binding subunit ClpC